MFVKYQSLFRSRWRAAIWACGVLLTAYCAVPSAEQTEQKEAAAARAAHPANPWALDKKPG
jgi:hypothetical protein